MSSKCKIQHVHNVVPQIVLAELRQYLYTFTCIYMQVNDQCHGHAYCALQVSCLERVGKWHLSMSRTVLYKQTAPVSGSITKLSP